MEIDELWEKVNKLPVLNLSIIDALFEGINLL